MINTLIVDDSPVVRKILRDFLEGEGSFKIIGEAENGVEGVDMAKQLRPDLVTMDFEMPLMNGLEAIIEIRKFSECGIVVISSHDTARMAYEATANGAHEFFAKNIFTSQITDMQRNNVISTLKHITNIKKNIVTLNNKETETCAVKGKVNCIVIASSTGGPMALSQLCSGLPETFNVPILLVQHNTSGFDKGFVQWLDEYAKLKVRLADNGIFPCSGHIYVAPTDKHLIIGSGGLVLDDGNPLNNQKPAADILFKSAAQHFGSSLASVVLTGMGSDGAEGTIAVKKAGGITISQDASTSMIYGMPEAAYNTGCVDMVLPLNKIAGKLLELSGGGT